MRVAVLGASGYVGGELLRLLLGHPGLQLVAATSDRRAGRPVASTHPNLRGHTTLRFTRHDDATDCDVLFSALPPGGLLERWADGQHRAPVVIDLSPDFRLADAEVYQNYYHREHLEPKWLDRFTTGLAELHREQLRSADHIAVPGCSATAAILGLYPLARRGLIHGPVLVDVRAGSSGGGATIGAGSHHPTRSGTLRVYRPSGHRHEAEITQAFPGLTVHVTATAVEAVRGVQALLHVTLPEPLTETELLRLYGEAYAGEPFVRLVHRPGSIHRYPEPKLLSGTNYCDVGPALTADGHRVVVVTALDNLMKGAAGNAVQAANVRLGLDERAGLEFMGLYPL
jgi:N-acetyl-gamma-glutamyl-phosphate/LysW-gamma-L-alpha-aminoadipyl-6-phosphate reductase